MIVVTTADTVRYKSHNSCIPRQKWQVCRHRDAAVVAFLRLLISCNRTPHDSKGPIPSLRGSKRGDNRNPGSDPPPIDLVLLVRANEYLRSQHPLGCITRERGGPMPESRK